ncbi:MAG: N-acetylneuraminate synthase family protein [Candidatus Thermoplasmatota archaeon]|nr:N-acetylneuraminate synthase family protein [Candidatus Thermoplasmatota archaeon]
MEIRIKDRAIGDNNPVFIIGEMAWSHDGSLENAKKIIKGLADANGNAISMHITHMEDYMTKTYLGSKGITVSGGEIRSNIYDYLLKISLSESDWIELYAYAKELGLLVCSQCNDMQSLIFSKKINPDLYVIPAACFAEKDFLIATAKTKKPIILRIGGATKEEIKAAIRLLKDNGNSRLLLLHGIQMYPTKIEDTQLRLIPTLKKMFGFPTGIADHIDADLEFALIVPQLAVALGANLVEKHITYDRSKKGEDFESALNPDEFKKLVEQIRCTERALGLQVMRPLSKAEIKYRDVVRKKTVAAVDIKKHQTIKKNMITFKRADEGIRVDETKKILGRKAKDDIKKDEGITLTKVTKR